MNSQKTYNPEVLSYKFTKKGKIVEVNTKNARLLRFAIFASLTMLLLWIFIQLFYMTRFATSGDRVAELESIKNELLKENRDLNKRIAEVKTYTYAKDHLDSSKFVSIEVNELQYLEAVYNKEDDFKLIVKE